jgi:hypothetical protein
MPDVGEFTRYYKTLNDAELLNLKSQGGFAEEAERAAQKKKRSASGRHALEVEGEKQCPAMNGKH